MIDCYASASEVREATWVGADSARRTRPGDARDLSFPHPIGEFRLEDGVRAP
jgi:hypothetical protein